ncbi:uncharacterized protein LOC129773564 [Toxorhynchites rutilus septentrionalis]|uniref:uncharacterized protein LOC129773564 n=1 Tax=Toxorhynchites rutilus septentrionalis TaxID=329112 RepID=UPI0024784712|nr:uncharacterized protein LOC129773564 [Toxorhynchites rutilus septentrionalis]
MSDSEDKDSISNVTQRSKSKVEKMSDTEKLQQENERLRQQIELLQTQRQLQEALTQLQTRSKMPEPREMESLVSKFDPKDPTSLTAEEWVKSINSVARSYNWTDDAKLYCARLQLQGAARLWFEGVRDEVADWSTFTTAIKGGFPSSKSSIHYHNLMQSRRRLPTETIEEFVYCMNAMGKRGGFDEQTIVTYIINGLTAFLYRSKVSVTNTNTVQDLLTQLKWIEQMQGLGNANVESQRVGTSKPAVSDVAGTSGITDTRGKMKKCFRCHQEGHWKRDCPLANQKYPFVGQRADNSSIKIIQRKSAFVKPVVIGDLNLTALDNLVMIKRGSEVKFKLESEERTNGSVEDFVNEKPMTVFKIDVSEEKGVIVANDIKCGGSLTAQSQLLEVMNNYRQCFSKTMKELGVANDAEMKIVLKDTEPVYVKPRKLEYTREAALSEIVADLVEAGIIEETESPYNSPVVLVPKKDNQFRMAVDYRQLNAKTVKDRFPMPDIESCLNKLAGGKIFISVDLYSACGGDLA